MKFEEWIEYHDSRAKRHSPDDLYSENNNQHIAYHEDHGFIRYIYDKEHTTLYITEIAGNQKFWESIYMQIAKDFGASKVVGFSSIKKPKVVERLFKAKVEKVIQDGDRIIYQFAREVI